MANNNEKLTLQTTLLLDLVNYTDYISKNENIKTLQLVISNKHFFTNANVNKIISTTDLPFEQESNDFIQQALQIDMQNFTRDLHNATTSNNGSVHYFTISNDNYTYDYFVTYEQLKCFMFENIINDLESKEMWLNYKIEVEMEANHKKDLQQLPLTLDSKLLKDFINYHNYLSGMDCTYRAIAFHDYEYISTDNYEEKQDMGDLLQDSLSNEYYEMATGETLEAFNLAYQNKDKVVLVFCNGYAGVFYEIVENEKDLLEYIGNCYEWGDWQEYLETKEK